MFSFGTPGVGKTSKPTEPLLIYILVEFEPGGKPYQYCSPVLVEVGSYVLVTVYNKVKAVKVLQVSNHALYEVNTKSIVGVCYTLEELEEEVLQPTDKTLLNDILNKVLPC